MSIRREGRGRRAVLAARATTACTAVAALLAVGAPSASAYVPCPRPIPDAEILNWQTHWPTSGADAKGVTLCQGFGSVLSKGYLQIVDLNDGAKLRLVSKVDARSPTPSRYEPGTLYEKRTADEWYSYIRAGRSVTLPATSQLFSTTNASFFKNADNSSPTALSFSHRFNYTHETIGMLWREIRDNMPPTGFGCPGGMPAFPDVCALKEVLNIGDPSVRGAQRIVIRGMLSFWDAPQAEYMLGDPDGLGVPQAWDATVAFDPLHTVGTTSRRNYIGFFLNRVYIFTSDKEYTNLEAESIMQAIQPGMTTMQLDGGGSAQFHSAYGHMDSAIPVLDRKVPDVIAIYRAP